MRGTANVVLPPIARLGITPACAGNSAGPARGDLLPRDHPRVCGEQFRGLMTNRRCTGSPPRVRGTARRPPLLRLPLGITPACAGNSFSGFPADYAGADHPRVCGEQALRARARCRRSGSPPRVRGTVLDGSTPGLRAGITPACAGNRASLLAAVPGTEDHPRVCGEQPAITAGDRLEYGSPPRVRGTVKPRRCMRTGRGITPACAGNRKTRWRSAAGAKDHPRVCGEQPAPSALPPASVGSPPRVRGTD